ncbi:MAG: CPBP family intramembrane glutamic endopeptidase [Desulfitobacteriia bacterium]|jgi:membrane protease YdiL (CAAX protease family)
MTRKLLLINIIFSQTLIVLIAWILKRLFLPKVTYLELFSLELNFLSLTTFLLGSCLLLFLQLLFHKYLPQERLFDEINLLLLEKFSLPILALIFLGGAIAEELLFRGIVQNILGIWLASLLFTLIHFRYLRKIYILLEVYLMGIILGIIYQLTFSLWIPILSHFVINFLTACLIKKGYLEY